MTWFDVASVLLCSVLGTLGIRLGGALGWSVAVFCGWAIVYICVGAWTDRT